MKGDPVLPWGVRTGSHAPRLVAVAVVACVAAVAGAAAAAPAEVHLGMSSGDPSGELFVSWMEATPRDGARVVIESSEGPREFSATLVPGPAAGAVYEARVSGLAPATTYAYRVDDRGFAFTTPPAELADDEFTFIALGDMGTSARAATTAETIRSLAPAFVLHAGDIAYAEGDQREWSRWFTLVEPVAATIPWMPALGNHETYTAAAGFVGPPSPAEIAYYKQRFGLPGNEQWYSFDWGGAHFVALDTFSQGDEVTARPPPPEELAWLREDLAAHHDALWTIAWLHEPPYSSNGHGSSRRVQEHFVPLFEEHGVDLVLTGHDHDYERSHPLRGGAPVTTNGADYDEGAGVVYVVTGGGGESLYADWASQPDWSAARAEIYHVLHVTVAPDRLEASVVPTQDDDFADSFRIWKPGARPGPDGPQESTSPEDGGDPTPLPGAGAGVAAIILAALAVRRRLRTA